MYDRFRWTGVSRRRNLAMAEYEPVQPYFLIALAEMAGCRTFIDVGANIGAYSVFASLIPTIERIVAFEANPKAAAEARANASPNGLSIEVFGDAVSNRAGPLDFGMVSDFAGNNGAVSTALHDGFRQTIPVAAVTLDAAIPNPASPLCLKIDVEGHEAQVIAGAPQLLGNPSVVQIECYQDDGGKALERLGYSHLTAIGPDHYYSSILTTKDVVAAYETAAQRMIDANHRGKAVSIQRGDFSLHLTGRSAGVARKVAKRLLGSRL